MVVYVGHESCLGFVCGHACCCADAFGVAVVVASLDEKWPAGEWEIGGVEGGADVAGEVAVSSFHGVLVVCVWRCVFEVDFVDCTPLFPVVGSERLMAIGDDFFDYVPVSAEAVEEVFHDGDCFVCSACACWCGYDELGCGACGAEYVFVSSDTRLVWTAVVDGDSS